MTPAPAFDLTDHVRAGQARGFAREGLLSSLGAVQRDIDAAEAGKLVMVTDWADLHRADEVASRRVPEGLLPLATALVDCHDMPIVMSGVPVEEFCLAELSAALHLSHGATRSLTEDALELRERLPRLWDKIHAGVLPVWKGRLVAKETRSLPDQAADYVDRQLAPFARNLTPARIHNLVAAAVLRFDPDRAAAASDGRGVWFDFEHGGAHPTNLNGAADPADPAQGDLTGVAGSRPGGVGRVEAVASTPDLLALRDALHTKARELEILGDHSSEQVRMSKGLGILADPQYALDLAATADLVLEEEAEAVLVGARAERASKPSSRPDRRPGRHRPVFGGDRPIHIHLHTSSHTARLQASGLPHTASPITRAAVEQWIRDLAPGVKVKVTPVIDLNAHHAVDQYEAPDHLRALVDERDGTCVFPYCTNRGRFDLDHIDPYLDPDEGGPPGQTSNHNLAKLCRYHHRAKTHTSWTYRRIREPWDLEASWPDPWIPDHVVSTSPTTGHRSTGDEGGPPAVYAWTSPLGLHYLVTATGTYPLD